MNWHPLTKVLGFGTNLLYSHHGKRTFEKVCFLKQDLKFEMKLQCLISLNLECAVGAQFFFKQFFSRFALFLGPMPLMIIVSLMKVVNSFLTFFSSYKKLKRIPCVLLTFIFSDKKQKFFKCFKFLEKPLSFTCDAKKLQAGRAFVLMAFSHCSQFRVKAWHFCSFIKIRCLDIQISTFPAALLELQQSMTLLLLGFPAWCLPRCYRTQLIHFPPALGYAL